MTQFVGVQYCELEPPPLSGMLRNWLRDGMLYAIARMPPAEAKRYDDVRTILETLDEDSKVKVAAKGQAQTPDCHGTTGRRRKHHAPAGNRPARAPRAKAHA